MPETRYRLTAGGKAVVATNRLAARLLGIAGDFSAFFDRADFSTVAARDASAAVLREAVEDLERAAAAGRKLLTEVESLDV